VTPLATPHTARREGSDLAGPATGKTLGEYSLRRGSHSSRPFGFFSTLARAAARDGILVADELAKSETAARIDADRQPILEQAVEHCPASSDLFKTGDARDGPHGTPIAADAG